MSHAKTFDKVYDLERNANTTYLRIGGLHAIKILYPRTILLRTSKILHIPKNQLHTKLKIKHADRNDLL